MYNFTEEKLKQMPENTRDEIQKQMKAYAEEQKKPIIAQFFYITDGATTRDGGTVLAKDRGVFFAGRFIAAVGDKVVYPDGCEAEIISGAGRAMSLNNKDGSYSSVAVLGSRLSNGDVVISTPNAAMSCVIREGGKIPEGFLVDYFKAD
jgi:uncharacterized Zn-binding protein involved in type VI secretion